MREYFAKIKQHPVSVLSGTLLLFIAFGYSVPAFAAGKYDSALVDLALAGMLRITAGLVRKGTRGMGCLFFLVILLPCLFLFAPIVFAAFEVIGHVFESILTVIKSPDDDDDFPSAPPSDRS